MSNIDKQALREAAERAMHDDWGYDTDIFHEQVTPSVVLALLDERERNQQYIKLRDQENEDIALTVGKLRVELEAAKKRIAEQSAIVAAAEKLVRCKGRYHSELNYRALAKLFGVNTPDLPPMDGESRTVMMPEPFKMAKSSSGLMYYYADEVDKALAAAGIKVKE
ncbi:ead/Ea22-like family protein [Salmonella enterica]|nr:ead/Ea22-like family protein [Salmonella enterica]